MIAVRIPITYVQWYVRDQLRMHAAACSIIPRTYCIASTYTVVPIYIATVYSDHDTVSIARWKCILIAMHRAARHTRDVNKKPKKVTQLEELGEYHTPSPRCHRSVPQR